MKQAQQLRLIGDVLKTFGANGELIVKIREDIPRAILKNKEPVFIYIDGLSVPFYMKSVESKGTGKLVVVFEDMEIEALASELIGKSIYISSEKAATESDGKLDMLVGFTAIDESCGYIGVVAEIMDIPGNPCLVVADQKNREVIIPLNEELIVKIVPSKKQICLNVPDGLLELYS